MFVCHRKKWIIAIFSCFTVLCRKRKVIIVPLKHGNNREIICNVFNNDLAYIIIFLYCFLCCCALPGTGKEGELSLSVWTVVFLVKSGIPVV